MIRLDRAGWRLGQLLKDSSRSVDRAEFIVQPKKLLDRSPVTPISQKLALTLDRTGSLSFETLVRIVAAELYEDELRKGAGVLDIGLLGSRLFHEDVVRELHLGDGTFWDIQKSGSN